MKFFTDRNLTILLVVGIGLGVALGLMAQGAGAESAAAGFVSAFSIFGRLFLAVLKMVVVPLVLFSVCSGMANMSRSGEVGRKVFKTFAYFLATTGMSVFLGLVLVNVIGPGRGVDADKLRAMIPEENMASAGSKQASIAESAPESVGEFVDIQIRKLFMNPFRSLAEMNLLGVVVFGLLLGLVLARTGDRGATARETINGLNEALMSMVKLVIWLAPPGIMALTAELVSSTGLDILKPLAAYSATVVTGLLIHGFIVLPLILKLVGGYSPVKFFMGIKQAMLLALSCASSSATLPVTLANTQENLGVDKETAEFVLPIGATVNMDGTALYESVAAIFIAQMIGLHLGFGQQVMVFLTATLAAIGAAGIPSAGLVTMVVVFNAVGLPLEYIAIIIIVDRPLDNLRTMINVEGDAVGSVVISESERAKRPPPRAGERR